MSVPAGRETAFPSRPDTDTPRRGASGATGAVYRVRPASASQSLPSWVCVCTSPAAATLAASLRCRRLRAAAQAARQQRRAAEPTDAATATTTFGPPPPGAAVFTGVVALAAAAGTGAGAGAGAGAAVVPLVGRGVPWASCRDGCVVGCSDGCPLGRVVGCVEGPAAVILREKVILRGGRTNVNSTNVNSGGMSHVRLLGCCDGLHVGLHVGCRVGPTTGRG